MNRLLFLAHRIPYPPNKGDKIRSFHMLRFLARHYKISLGTFVDDPDDWSYTSAVADMCEETYFAPLSPARSRIRSLSGFLTGNPLTLSYYHHGGLHDWVAERLRSGRVTRIFVFSSAMARYVMGDKQEGMRSVVDFVDIDSDKWAQYSSAMGWPKSWVYAYEAKALARYEREVAAWADVGIFVSRAEAELFRNRAPEVANKVSYVSNGVDAEFFSPSLSYPRPYDSARKAIVFTGAMDYWPNVDAVSWFAREVFPEIRKSDKDTWFYIVGARPSPAVLQLAEMENIEVTGRVADVRPYLAHAHVVVAPLRVARGVQNKVLEAMAMAKPIVATSMAMEGLTTHSAIRCADEAAAFAQATLKVLQAGAGGQPGEPALRECVMHHYDWNTNLKVLLGMLEGASESRSVA